MHGFAVLGWRESTRPDRDAAWAALAAHFVGEFVFEVQFAEERAVHDDPPERGVVAVAEDPVEEVADAAEPGGVHPGGVPAPEVGVAAVTNPEPEPGTDRHQQYRHHVAHALEASPWARVIKASDFSDNGAGLVHTSGPKLDKLAGKYAPLVPVLREMIARPDTPLSAEAKAHILARLDRAAERFAAIQQAS